ncbi:MAG: methionyl-tRNA formyltransferase [Gemmatimonadota bacterium]|nr:methionyl-tRNA formyltransferase [Gemmatimonadota bacterium]
MKVLFWGTPDFAVPALRALDEEGHEIVAVVTQPDRPAGRGRPLGISPVKQIAVQEDIPVLQPERARGAEFEAQIGELSPDVSVVVAYGQILRPEVLAIPPWGSINIHASLLPELRGAAPIAWAIIRGYEVTGITIMRMDAGLDSGPILLPDEVPIRPDESAGGLARRLSVVGADAILDALSALAAGKLAETPQDHARATYAPKLDRETARLRWNLPAEQVARWIRGLDPLPGGWSTLADGSPLKLFSPMVEDASGDPGTVLEADHERGMLVAAGVGAVRVHEVQPAGKRRMSAGEWVRGRGITAGSQLV